jgi:DNA-binding transcriptional MerR regulator
MKNGMSIGRFSTLTTLSVRSLRLYDEMDLLTPAFIDPDTNYRFYGTDQVARALQIRAFREMGLSLPKIRQILQNPEDAAEQLKLYRHELRDRFETLQARLKLLNEAIKA